MVFLRPGKEIHAMTRTFRNCLAATLFLALVPAARAGTLHVANCHGSKPAPSVVSRIIRNLCGLVGTLVIDAEDILLDGRVFR
jgi:hypothetical protein